jgi:hypothetical protein
MFLAHDALGLVDGEHADGRFRCPECNVHLEVPYQDFEAPHNGYVQGRESNETAGCAFMRVATRNKRLTASRHAVHTWPQRMASASWVISQPFPWLEAGSWPEQGSDRGVRLGHSEIEERNDVATPQSHVGRSTRGRSAARRGDVGIL